MVLQAQLQSKAEMRGNSSLIETYAVPIVYHIHIVRGVHMYSIFIFAMVTI
jgi:hypothetical protein